MIRVQNKKPVKQELATATEPGLNLIPSPTSGVVPPVEHRWKKGQSGNPGGKPKVVMSAYERALREPVEITENVVEGDKIVKKTRIGMRAELIAQNMATEAASKYRIGTAGAQIGAMQEMRKVTEPTDEEQDKGGSIDRELTRLVATLLLVGREKPVQAFDIPSEA